jgi:EmrB/QacA subfamily drug resistance transporter
MDEPARKRAILILCCVSQFMVILDVSVVNVALPSIRHDLGFSVTGLQWVVNAYTLAFGGFLLLGGRAADLIGRRTMFVSGLALFSVASLIGGLSESQGTLIAARFAQGLGGAIVAPATLSVLSATFVGAERNRAMGAWSSMGGVGGVSGAILGGLLTQGLGWQWILFINVPIGLTAAAVALRVVEQHEVPDQRRNFDVLGAVVVTAGLVALTYGIVSTESHGWTSVQTLGPMLVGLALIGLFVIIERSVATRPLVDFSIFRSRAVTGANVVIFALGAGSFAMWFLLSLYLQGVLGYDPIQTGLAFVPGALGIVAGSLLAGRLTTRHGPGRVMIGGLVLVSAGLLWLSRTSTDGSLLLDVLIPLTVVTVGIGLAFVPSTIAAMSGVAPDKAGLASGVLNTSRQVGGSLGIAVLATVAAHQASVLLASGHTKVAALSGGYDHGFAIGAAISAAGAIAGFLLLPRSRPAQAAPARGAARSEA